ncbi:hypothetical protein [Scytonema sp. PCC 10023]|uniref:hypothetical protein n=1 Tax=Scytonema sp. PCC 10023 TaxID=1680591 RepID=UPI0039C73E63
MIPCAKLSASDLLTIADSSVDQAKQEECDRMIAGRSPEALLCRSWGAMLPLEPTQRAMAVCAHPCKAIARSAVPAHGDRVVILSL